MSTTLRKCISLGQGWAVGTDASQSMTYNPTLAAQPDNVYFLKDSGTPWVKIWAVPYVLWTSPSAYSASAFTALDVEIHTAKANGFRVLLTMSSQYFPSWLTENGLAKGFPASISSTSVWASMNAQILSRYSPLNPSRPTEFSWIDMFEPLNEPDGMNGNGRSTVDKYNLVADMLKVVKQQQVGSGILVGGPGMLDAAGYDSRTNYILARFNANNFYNVGTNAAFAWTAHLYDDVQGRPTGSATNGAAIAGMLQSGGFKGWPNGLTSSPAVFNTESGYRRPAGYVTNGTYDIAQSGYLNNALTDFATNGSTMGRGVEMITQYLTYTDTAFDTGLLQPRPNGVVYRQAYNTWKAAPSADWPLPGPPGWSGWEVRGGVASSSAPAVASWGTGRLDLFVRDGTVLKTTAFSGGAWSAWNTVPGTLEFNDVDAVSWGPNRIDVVGVTGTGAVSHTAWDGTTWSTDFLGGVALGGPAICSWGAGRLDVFVRGTDNALYHCYWAGAGWSAWESLGGILNADPAVACWGYGRIDVFSRDNANTLVHKFFDAGAGGWSGWESLGGGLTSSPAVSSWGPGRLDVFALGAGNRLYHLPFGAAGWGAWEQMGTDSWTAKPAAVSWGANRIDLFAKGSENYIYQRRYGS